MSVWRHEWCGSRWLREGSSCTMGCVLQTSCVNTREADDDGGRLCGLCVHWQHQRVAHREESNSEGAV